MSTLLSRDQFREGVFARDGHRCVVCHTDQGPLDAHHIVERRLFPDGGYYLDNGATVCSTHHLAAEATELTCEMIREAAGIKNVILPPHLYPDERYDKWGNIYTTNDRRIPGELFEDESVQKILAPVLSEFGTHVKYPRTHHLPWSANVSSDDRLMHSLEGFVGEDVVMTEKLDGENTSLYSDGLHQRSLDYEPHPSRDRMKATWAQIAGDIPHGWRVCVENCFAAHSIHYKHLTSFFYLISVWNEKNLCLSWDETVEWGELLNIPTPPVLYRGPFSESAIRNTYLPKNVNGDEREGYVVRVTRAFSYREFRHVVGKYVRKDHVRTHGHWARSKVIPNVIDYALRK